MLSPGASVAGYYRSQFLNTVLPGGVLGDVHRGVRHGAGSAARGLRAVVWERGAGQVVQLAISLVLLCLLPSPLRPAMPVLLVAAAAAVGVGLLAARIRGRVAHALRSEVRRAMLAPRIWPGVVTASVCAVGGHLLLFLVAARAAGVDAPLTELVPLGLIVLVAMGIPANLAGWGPREGVAAWAFAAAGVGAGAGVSTAVLYGVLTLIACLPGAPLLGPGRRPPAQPARRPVEVTVGRG